VSRVYSTIRRAQGLPSTVIGKWAGGLLLVFIALLTWTVVGVNFGGLERGTVLTDVVAVGMMGATAAKPESTDGPLLLL